MANPQTQTANPQTQTEVSKVEKKKKNTIDDGPKKSYPVSGLLRHNGEGFKKGDKVSLTPARAAQLRKFGAIGGTSIEEVEGEKA